MLAIEEINADGGVLGRQLEAKILDLDMMTPEGNVAAIQALIEGGSHAIASAFTIIPTPAMDTAAPSGIPYLHGNTSTLNVDIFKGDLEKYKNIFQQDVPESYYGSGFVKFLQDMTASAQWEPKNNKIHIVQGQISYTQLISKATQEAIAETNGEWEVGAITDIQFPVQDWAPVIRALQDTDAAAIMIDHWVAADLRRLRNNTPLIRCQIRLCTCSTGRLSLNSVIWPKEPAKARSGTLSTAFTLMRRVQRSVKNTVPNTPVPWAWSLRAGAMTL